MSTEIVILARSGSMHHTKPLLEHFGARSLVESEWLPAAVMRHQPSLLITFDEHGAELGLCVGQAARSGVATLQAMDGILEWRRTWHYPTSPEKRPLNQPALSHKIACLGRADARILESWGNIGKCEIVGSPRFDRLAETRRPIRTEPVAGRPLRLLIMTAKTPGFTPEQVEVTFRSLLDLKKHLAERQDVEVIWRVTQKLHERLGVENTVRNILSTELHDILGEVDAIITTPSTAMLESMLCGHPVAILDYHNCPHYVPAAWSISCEGHIEPVLEELKAAPLARMLFQELCLEDALACRTPALPRMALLIDEMLRIREECLATSKPLAFPHRLLQDSAEQVAWPSKAFDLKRLYPHHRVFGNCEVTVLQAELEAALGTISNLKSQAEVLSRRLNRIPGYRLAVNLYHALKQGRLFFF